MEKKYEFFEHTADAKFRAYGKTIEEQFSNAALAMTSIMLDPLKVERKTAKKIFVKGEDLKSLLYNFLEEILYVFDTKLFILADIKTISIRKKYELVCVLAGDKAENYKISSSIKAVTYNEMEITKDHVQLVVDI